MILYIIRHGDPDYENDTLTEFGRKEAEILGERMAKEAPDLIFMSPRGRAIATAEPTCRRMGKEGVIEPWMTERNEYMFPIKEELRDTAGFTYTLKDGVTELHDYNDDEERRICLNGLVESSDAFLEKLGYRREGALYRVVNDNDLKVACYCHGGFGTAWISHLLGMLPSSGAMRFGMDTVSITKFEFKQERVPGYVFPVMTAFNDVYHLREVGLDRATVGYGN